MKNYFFEKKNKENLIKNIVIQQLRRNNVKTFCKIKKFLKFILNLLIIQIKKL